MTDNTPEEWKREFDRLSPSMRKEICGIAPNGRSENGGRTQTVQALRKRGVYRIHDQEFTPFGEWARAVLLSSGMKFKYQPNGAKLGRPRKTK